MAGSCCPAAGTAGVPMVVRALVVVCACQWQQTKIDLSTKSCHSSEKSGAGLPGWQEGGCGTQEWESTGWSQPEIGGEFRTKFSLVTQEFETGYF